MIIQIFTTTKTNQIIYQLCHKGTLICSGLVDALDSRLYLVLLTVTRLTIQTFEGCAHAITLQVGIELYTLMIQKTYYPVSLLCPHQRVTVSFLFLQFHHAYNLSSGWYDMCLLLHLPPVLNCFILPSSLLRRRRNNEGTVSPNVRKSKTVLDFGFHLPGIGIPCRWILDSNPWAEFPVIWIPQAKPGLPYMRRHCLSVLPLHLSLLDVKGIPGCNKSLEYQP